MRIRINCARILKDIEMLSRYTDTIGAGVTRFSYGENDRNARSYLISEAKKFELVAEVDAVGNIRIYDSENSDKQKIVTGSHIDTVQNGGRLDGTLGVVGGLEVLRCLKENNVKLDVAVELVIFAEEEGSNFGSTMTGSKFIAGVYNEEDLLNLKNNDGKSLEAFLIENNYPVSDISKVPWDFERVKAMVELHIEQGPVLDSEQLEIGIVQTIFGMRVTEITLRGLGNHAGASPMEGRRDALACAAEIILEIEKLAGLDEDKRMVATVGKLKVYPNASNVIPDTVKFTVEVRDTDNEKIKKATESILEKMLIISKRRNVECVYSYIAESLALPMNVNIKDIILDIAKNKKLKYKIMNSGAVHDCCMIATKVNTGMIFVPSVDGRSHVPEEFTKDEHLEMGVQLLLDSVLMFCQR